MTGRSTDGSRRTRTGPRRRRRRADGEHSDRDIACLRGLRPAPVEAPRLRTAEACSARIANDQRRASRRAIAGARRPDHPASTEASTRICPLLEANREGERRVGRSAARDACRSVTGTMEVATEKARSCSVTMVPMRRVGARSSLLAGAPDVDGLAAIHRLDANQTWAERARRDEESRRAPDAIRGQVRHPSRPGDRRGRPDAVTVTPVVLASVSGRATSMASKSCRAVDGIGARGADEVSVRRRCFGPSGRQRASRCRRTRPVSSAWTRASAAASVGPRRDRSSPQPASPAIDGGGEADCRDAGNYRAEGGRRVCRAHGQPQNTRVL